MSANDKYAEDLAVVLERLLSQLSMLSNKTDYIYDAYTQATNVLDEYQQAKDAEEILLKAEEETTDIDTSGRGNDRYGSL